MADVSCCRCSLFYGILYGSGQGGNFSLLLLHPHSPQNSLILVRHGNSWMDSTRFSSSVFHYSSLYLFCSIIRFTLFHLLSTPLSYFQLTCLLLFSSPSLLVCVFNVMSLHIMLLGSTFTFKSKTLNSSEAPYVPVRPPLWTTPRGATRLPAFSLLIEKHPNGRPCKHFYLWPFSFFRK